jgi:hypothetical protein
MTNSAPHPSLIERNPRLSKTTKILFWVLSGAAILFGLWSLYNARSMHVQLNTVRTDLAAAQNKLRKLDDKLSADEYDIRDMCAKLTNQSSILSRPENAAVRESLGADFLTDQVYIRSVACRLEGKIQ